MKNLKKIVILLVMFFCLSMLSACIRFSTTVTVKRNGKVDITLLMATMISEDEDESEEYNDKEENENREKLEKEGWKYEEYNEDGYVGYSITKSNVDLEDIGEAMGGEDDVNLDTDSFSVKKDGSKYTISWDITGSEDYEEGESYASSLETYGGYGKFILVLPNKPISHNAHEVSDDGKTLTWNIFEMENGEKIEAEFIISRAPLIIGIILIILLIAVLVVAFIILQKKGIFDKLLKRNNTIQDQEYYDPNQQG